MMAWLGFEYAFYGPKLSFATVLLTNIVKNQSAVL